MNLEKNTPKTTTSTAIKRYFPTSVNQRYALDQMSFGEYTASKKFIDFGCFSVPNIWAVIYVY
jgi:hypothetical protein